VVIPGRKPPHAITIHPSLSGRTHSRALWHGIGISRRRESSGQPVRGSPLVDLCCTISVTFFLLFFFVGQRGTKRNLEQLLMDSREWRGRPEGIPTDGRRIQVEHGDLPAKRLTSAGLRWRWGCDARTMLNSTPPKRHWGGSRQLLPLHLATRHIHTKSWRTVISSQFSRRYPWN